MSYLQKFLSKLLAFFPKRERVIVYDHVIALAPHKFTTEEAKALQQFGPVFRKIIDNKLMASNAASYWSDQNGFFKIKGKVEVLEELISFLNKLDAEPDITSSQLIPLVHPSEKTEVKSGNFF